MSESTISSNNCLLSKAWIYYEQGPLTQTLQQTTIPINTQLEPNEIIVEIKAVALNPGPLPQPKQHPLPQQPPQPQRHPLPQQTPQRPQLRKLQHQHQQQLVSMILSIPETTTTTTARPTIFITRAGDTIVGIYNTTAGTSTGGLGLYLSGESPDKAIDNDTSTKYLNFGYRGTSAPSNAVYDQPGATTGFYVTPQISNASVAVGVLFATANDYSNRDPISITLEGTNATGSALSIGSSWTLIYSGSTGINATVDPGRYTYGVQQTFLNTIPYSSYRILVTAQRANGSGVQYSEAHILGYI
ncbi:unnamed protein product [Rotaria sordida]|uniref:Uncharacterized protein n=1 Tax=Rotaria sordida TaxID=392033 RepID=A0A819BLD9_9BILA|nr:unnamed protein product [Rotaria sordida]CAF3803821.1 unnamed protein product [Rotaria sordida]